MFVRTRNLLLRPGWPEDWSALYAEINDEQIVANLASAPWPYGEEDARSYAARSQDIGLPHFLATLPGENGQRLVGSCGLGRSDRGDVELGYWIARPFWGRGYATEAARGVIEVAQMLGHRRLTAGHFVDNPVSGAVLRKLGFRPSGVVRPRFSAGRGIEAMSREFVLDLEPESWMPGDDSESIAA